MSVDLIKVANVLEAAADHFDAVENEKVSAIHNEREKQIDILASKYAEATGEEMPQNIRQKLAASDKDVVSLLNSMVEKQAGNVESLGSPSDKNDDRVPVSVKEASDQAEDRFLNWIVS